MSKSILPPIDTPNSCISCSLYKICDYYSPYNKRERHPQCPLKDITKVLSALQGITSHETRIDQTKNNYDALQYAIKALGGNDNE